MKFHILLTIFLALAGIAPDAATASSPNKKGMADMGSQYMNRFKIYYPEADITPRNTKLANEMLGHVENITIIDSISVPADDFFKHYRIPTSQGKIGLECFTGENGETTFLSMPDDELGTTFSLYEQTRLADESMEEPVKIDIPGLDAPFVSWPFMLTDGTTLYFAAYSETEGLGGFDIYVTGRNQDDGTFRIPQNVGMPYNSPANDYLMAFDEDNNVGWWATDRNSPDGMITVYTFIKNDIRVNYDPTTDNIISKALIEDWKSTQDADEDYSELRENIRNIGTDKELKYPDFYLQITPSLVYYYYSDFKTNEAKEAMSKYVDAGNKLKAIEIQLKDLRRQYHERPKKDLGQRIEKMEQQRDEAVAKVANMRSNLFRIIKKTL